MKVLILPNKRRFLPPCVYLVRAAGLVCKMALCDWDQNELSAYVETALQEGLAIAGSNFPRFRRHLDECEDCRDEVLELLPLFWLLQTGLAAEPPREGEFDFWFLAT